MPLAVLNLLQRHLAQLVLMALAYWLRLVASFLPFERSALQFDLFFAALKWRLASPARLALPQLGEPLVPVEPYKPPARRLAALEMLLIALPVVLGIGAVVLGIGAAVQRRGPQLARRLVARLVVARPIVLAAVEPAPRLAVVAPAAAVAVLCLGLCCLLRQTTLGRVKESDFRNGQ